MNRVHCGDRVYDNVPDLVRIDTHYRDIYLDGTIDTTGERPGITDLMVDADHPLSGPEMSWLPWGRIIESAIARSVGQSRPDILADHPSYRLADQGEDPHPP